MSLSPFKTITRASLQTPIVDDQALTYEAPVLSGTPAQIGFTGIVEAWEITSNNASDWNITNVGVLSPASDILIESVSYVEIEVRGPYGTDTARITVLATAEPPVVDDQTIVFVEGTAPGQGAEALSVTSGNVQSWVLTGPDSDKFQINAQGRITPSVTTTIGEYYLIATAIGAGGEVSASVLVNVRPVNLKILTDDGKIILTDEGREILSDHV